MLGRVVLRVVDDDGGSDPEASGVALVAGVPYVRGWADAEAAAELLRAELAAWGIGDRMRVHAQVSAGGVGVVELGWVSPEVARLLAGLLEQARVATPSRRRRADAA
ncbi:hypothetical protein [Phytohabitans houttuyneae]|nr:hypothetical protein [Phytohabitans houttuyneae]